MNKLDPNAKVLFYMSGVITLVFFFFILLFPFLIALVSEGGLSVGAIFLVLFFVLLFVVLVPLPYAHLSYENYGYELKPDRINIERGIIWKRHISIPYERVQNVDILRGPLLRMMELSDLQIQTAGATHVAMEGRIPGITVSEANNLRDEIMAKVPGNTNRGV